MTAVRLKVLWDVSSMRCMPSFAQPGVPFQSTGQHLSRGPRGRSPGVWRMCAIGSRPDVAYRVTFVQTHPVQYMAPLFRYIASHCTDIDLSVLYASTPMPHQQGVGFGECFEWDVALTDGYAHRVLLPPSVSRRFDSDSFAGVDVGP